MQKNWSKKSLLLLVTVGALVTFLFISATETWGKSLVAQATPDISGNWNSNIGLVYEFTQNGEQFTWFVALNNQKGGGTLSGQNLSASWSDAEGSGSATGRITAFDANSRAGRIEWDNGVIFERAGAESFPAKPAQLAKEQRGQRRSTLQPTQPTAPQPAALAVPKGEGLYLYINGIKGSSHTAGAEDWIEVMHFKQSLSSFRGSGGGGGRELPSFSPLVITKVVDIASPFLNIYCAAGKNLSDVTLIHVSSKKFIDYRVRIEGVMISAIEVVAPDEKGRILENVSLLFSRCTWEFHDTNPDGSLGPAIIKKFDLKLNSEI